MKKLLISVSMLSLLLSGCSSSEQNDSAKSEAKNESTVMEVDYEYTLNRGDRVDKTSDDALLRIVKNSQFETSRVTLLRGEAVLTRKESI